MTSLTADPPAATSRSLLRPLLLLAAPVLAEHALHIVVGLTDAYLANNMIHTAPLQGAALEDAHRANAAAGAAIGSITYILWFVGLIVSSIGTGSTAIIARAVGARHRRLANKVAGQSIVVALVLGSVFGAALYLATPYIAQLAALPPDAAAYFRSYVHILAPGLPFAVLMFTANSCLRGAGDTVTPAIAMITVDVVNVVVSASLTWGLLGMPAVGFDGIAIGTMAAYVTGGLLQTAVLLIGRGGLRLYLHRLRPDWHTIRRVMRIGLPAGGEGLLMWLGNFVVLRVVNELGTVAGTAHNLTIRMESLSFMTGFAIATAVATMVGQSLGARDPHRARRTVLVGYAVGAVGMALLGLTFIAASHGWASLFTDDPLVIEQAAQCLFYAGFIQAPFAASFIFGAALRGAGDTTAVMVLSLASILIVRCGGVWLVGQVNPSLPHVWIVLCAELCVRGALMYARFATGRWQHAKV